MRSDRSHFQVCHRLSVPALSCTPYPHYGQQILPAPPTKENHHYSNVLPLKRDILQAVFNRNKNPIQMNWMVPTTVVNAPTSLDIFLEANFILLSVTYIIVITKGTGKTCDGYWSISIVLLHSVNSWTWISIKRRVTGVSSLKSSSIGWSSIC